MSILGKRDLAFVAEVGELAAAGFPFFLLVPGHLGFGLCIRILDQRDLILLRRARDQTCRCREQKKARD